MKLTYFDHNKPVDSPHAIHDKMEAKGCSHNAVRGGNGKLHHCSNKKPNGGSWLDERDNKDSELLLIYNLVGSVLQGL